MDVFALILLGFVVSFVLGWSVCLYRQSRSDAGTIHIDRSDPDGPHLFLELRFTVDELADKKQVRVLVDNSDLTTRK